MWRSSGIALVLHFANKTRIACANFTAEEGTLRDSCPNTASDTGEGNDGDDSGDDSGDDGDDEDNGGDD